MSPLVRRDLLAGLLGTAAALPLLRARAGERQGNEATKPAAQRHSQPLRLPPPLAPGARVVAVAPGTWWEDAQAEAERLRGRFAAAGWLLVVPGQAMGRWRWFSASDTDRLAALAGACADPSTAAVVSVAGGWGSARLLERGWRPSRRPLWLVGFSDASALLLAQLAAGQGGGIHASLGGDEAQWQRLVRLLRREQAEPLQGTGWRDGVAVGPLVVSNLTVATHLIGTPWFPDLRGRLLVLEDTGEAPYRIDRLLTHWRSSGVLQEVAGIGLGRFSWKEDDILQGDLSMEQVLQERLGDLGVPLVGRLPVGHGRPNLALPMGQLAQLDGRRGSLELL